MAMVFTSSRCCATRGRSCCRRSAVSARSGCSRPARAAHRCRRPRLAAAPLPGGRRRRHARRRRRRPGRPLEPAPAGRCPTTADRGPRKVEAALGHRARAQPAIRLDGHPLPAHGGERGGAHLGLRPRRRRQRQLRDPRPGAGRLPPARRPLVSAAVQGLDGQLSTFKAHLGAPHPCLRCLFPEDAAADALSLLRARAACSGRPRPSSRACRRSRW